MKNNVNILAYRFGKGAEIHDCSEAPALIYETIQHMFEHHHIHFSWIETIPEHHRLFSHLDEFGAKPRQIKNKTAVIEAVTHLAHHVALTMLTKEGLPFVVGGDHTQGLGTSKGMILASTVKALLSGILPVAPQGIFLREALHRSIEQQDMQKLSLQTGELLHHYVDKKLFNQFLASIYVIWFDAHGDYNTTEITPTGNAHGMAAAAICGEGDSGLTGIIGHWAKIPSPNMHFVAVRDLDQEEQRFMQEKHVHIHSMEKIQEQGLDTIIHHILQEIKQGSAKKNTFPPLVHLSFDIDGIDAKYVPATGTPVGEGSSRNPTPGPSLAQTVEAFAGIAKKVTVIDLSESNFHPERDPQGITLQSVSAILKGFFHSWQ